MHNTETTTNTLNKIPGKQDEILHSPDILTRFFPRYGGKYSSKKIHCRNLPSASSPLQKLEIMTNLMDLSRQEEQVEYAKQLYWLALEEDEDYYKEAALTENLALFT